MSTSIFKQQPTLRRLSVSSLTFINSAFYWTLVSTMTIVATLGVGLITSRYFVSRSPALYGNSVLQTAATLGGTLPIVPPATSGLSRQAGPESAPSASLTNTSNQPGPGQGIAYAQRPSSYDLGVLLIKYFPLTNDGQNIDISVTGDVGGPYNTVRQHTIDVTNNLLTDLSKATRYRGYANSSAPASLKYHIVDTKEYTQAVPFAPLPGQPRYPAYNTMMTQQNICNYVDNLGVREVWLWAYQGPNKGDNYPYLGIKESKMSGPFGDISNSERYNDMPLCQNTYRVYTFNYGRGTSEAMESWGHQMEAELDAINSDLFRNKFQGPNYPQTLGVTGRCGSVHNAPNARFEYDRFNPTPQPSDCLNWNPDGLGPTTSISCANWGCSDNGDADNPSLNYMIWNWQNLPGRLNGKTYQGQPLRNWWDVHGNFDYVMGHDRSLIGYQYPDPPVCSGRICPK